jgi:oligoendopeptidase F
VEQNHRRWDLRDLYADVEETVLDLEHRVDHLASSRSNLSPDTSTEDFLQLLNAYEGAACIQRRLAAFAFLRFA